MKLHPYPTRGPVTPARALRGALCASLGPLGMLAWLICMVALALIYVAYWLAVPVQRSMATEFTGGRAAVAVAVVLLAAVGAFVIVAAGGVA